jgi:hypothetical protein
MELSAELEKVLSSLAQLNEKSKVKILDQMEIQEQLENLQDFKRKSGSLYKLAESIEITNPNEVEEVCELILKLHFLFVDYMWQIDEIHELVKKMAGKYREEN